jgi:hypothetical protein
MKKYGLDSIFSPSDFSFLNISDKDALKSDMQNVVNDMNKIIKF